MNEIDSDPHGGGRFVVRRQLGAGGMGVVYEAYDRRRDETVALKTLHQRDAAALYQFKREFRTLADVAHPNLVSLYELIADERRCFFTMELIEGESFIDHVRPAAAGPPDEARLRAALRQVVHGVAAIHAAGKLHRDLKPSNVLVTAAGRAVILDFGLATERASRLQLESLSEGFSGTLAYMAPEQARNEAASPATDWYTVGMILFEALTGRLPFQGNLTEVLLGKLHRDAPSPRDFVAELPDDLVALCGELLDRDPARRPDAAAILRRLGDDPGAPALAADPGTDGVHLVGRRRELEVLASAFAAVRAGSTVSLYVHGTSGFGKSALINAFLAQLVDGDGAATAPVVLTGRCFERELVPYKAVDGVVDSLSRYLGTLAPGDVEALLPDDILALTRLFPVLRRLDAVERAARRGRESADQLARRRRAFAALRQLLGRIGERRPLVLYIDDLQWADADSAVLLADLLRPPESPRLLLLASFRSEEIDAQGFLRTLLAEARGDGHRELRIGPLPEAEAAELATALLGGAGGVPERLIRTIVREAEGSPFFIEQLVGYARASDSVLSTIVSLGEMLEARLRKLPAGASALVETLAVAARPIAAAVAYRAAGLAGDERPLVAALRAACLVRTSGSAERVEIYHDRIRETLAAYLSAERSREIHRRLVATLLQSGSDDPEALFEHYRQAGDDEQAARQAVLAACKASSALAFDRAALFYRRALDLGRFAGDEQRELRLGLAESLAGAGRPAESAEAFLAAAADAAPSEALRCRSLAAQEYLAGGYITEGLELIRGVLAAIGERLADKPLAAVLSYLWQRLRLRLRLRGLGFRQRDVAEIPAEELVRIDTCWATGASLVTVQPIQGLDFQTRHLRFALDAGEPVRIARALAIEASLQGTRGRAGQRQAERLVTAALDLARRLDDPFALALGTMHSGMTAYMIGRWRRGAEQCDEADAIFSDRCTGALWEQTTARRYALSCLMYLGELAEIRRRVPLQLAAASERGDVQATTNLRTRFSVYWLLADDPAAVHREVEDALRPWQGFHLQHYNGFLARSQADLYAGDPAAAWERLLVAWPCLQRSRLLRIQILAVEAEFLRGRTALAAAAGGDRTVCRGTALAAAARIARHKTDYGQPMADQLHAGVARLDGDLDRARHLLEQALFAYEEQEMHLYAAAVRWRLGELRGGDQGRAEIERAGGWLRDQDVRRPDLLVATMAPAVL